MSSRTIRRAAARQAEKAARRTRKEVPKAKEAPKAAAVHTESVVATEPVIALGNWTTCPEEISERRLAANRANAKLSTGPTTETGKRTSCLNAVKTGLTGQTVLLASDDVAAYEALVGAFAAQYQPATLQERQLVQNLADSRWRLNRIPTLEFALFARGQQEFADKFADYEPALASAMRDAETIVVYAKQLKNLHTQEGRLRRHYQQDLAELTALQQERRDAEAHREADANALATAGANGARPTGPNNDGFEFANVRPSQESNSDLAAPDESVGPDLRLRTAA